MYKKLLIFDLDGTVIDSSDAITSTFQDTLKQYGVEEPNKKILQSFIGPTLISTYSTHYGFSGNILEKVLATHKQIFKKNGIKKNYVYPGMHNFLSQMHTNVKFAVATTKYTEDALAILRSTNLSMFDYVQGADDTMIDNDKTNLIQKVISHYSPINKENIVMVGDRKFDIMAAQNCEIDSIGVTWGFGSKTELIQAHPTHIINEISELIQYI